MTTRDALLEIIQPQVQRAAATRDAIALIAEVLTTLDEARRHQALRINALTDRIEALEERD